MKSMLTRAAPMALLALILMVGLSSCARERTPPPTSVSVVLNATSEVNPDRNDRPSPIVVRVYELRSAGVFEISDFFTLLEQDSAVLGADQISRWEYQLEPGERVELDVEFRSGSGYVGVLAAYRDIEHARWRAVQPIQPNRANNLEVVMGRLEVAIRQQRP
ncbi:MAG: type VI secretion system lipoprotein TssJ [Wenzhouxiangella sp.]|nr:type VI secretion system lipoprotein TssJ [Wenzhouxiangella sp.]MCH8479088.1 type VI secretion system lipoprotein TssJ [Wenzhouxiangella sp.]TVR95968.1 MAG: type VI secretion system lipoprotein TssJ [Wenzhouxiangellaceae bacterium]